VNAQRPLLVLPFWHGDKHRLARMLGWLLQLGFTRDSYGKDIDVILAHNRRSNMSGVMNLARLAFARVEEFAPGDENESGWPSACNFLFARTLTRLAERRRPSLWLEADAVPLRVTFFDEICAAYAAAPPGAFMGKVSQLMGVHPFRFSGPFLHGGVAVYPEAGPWLHELVIHGYPWDCQISASTLVRPLLHHSGLFCDVKVCPEFRNAHDVALNIPAAACVFHHAKDGALIEVLSRQLLGCGSAMDSRARGPMPTLSELTTRHSAAFTTPARDAPAPARARAGVTA
jgi:hypothetical protein